MTETPSPANEAILDLADPGSPPQSYWGIVRRQFMRNRSAVAGLVIVLLMFAAAIFAPFLANGKPYYLKQQGEVSSPLLQALTPTDFILLCIPVFAIIWIILARLMASHKNLAFLISFMGFIMTALILIFTVESKDPPLDYREMSKNPGTVAVFAPIRFSPNETSLERKREPPLELQGHPLGTDDLGRDVASRLIWSARVSLAVGFVAQGLAVLIGVVLGGIAGYFGNRIDFVIMRVVEVMMCFPAFFLILTIVAFFGRNLWLIMAAIGLVSWTQNARFIRAEFLRLRKMEYAMAAQALGLGAPRIIFRHLLPNGMAPVLVNASFGVAAAIIVEGGLSFLGFGVRPPTPTWGTMLNDARVNLLAMPWMIILPGLAIFLAVTAYNLVGEGLRDALDPKLKI